MKRARTRPTARPPSPFPRDVDGRTVIDERCRCGAYRMEHADDREYGAGGCRATDCQRFSLESLVFAIALLCLAACSTESASASADAGKIDAAQGTTPDIVGDCQLVSTARSQSDTDDR